MNIIKIDKKKESQFSSLTVSKRIIEAQDNFINLQREIIVNKDKTVSRQNKIILFLLEESIDLLKQSLSDFETIKSLRSL